MKADALAKLGLLATTSGGADSSKRADWQPLAGRAALIWRDNDEAGKRYAEEVATILTGLGCTVSFVDVAKLDLPPKGDAVDWLGLHPGATAADVLALPTVEAETAAEPTEEQADPQADRETIERLAKLRPLEYDRVRRGEAKALGVRPSTLDRLVAAERKGDEECDDGGIVDVDPWQDPVEPAEVLSEIAATVRRFVVCDPETAHAVALWVAMTWFMDVVQIAPLAVITAPEKRCGKSLLLFLLGRLACRPLTASNISPAALFRCVDAWSPTLLVDEADAFVRENEELRGLVNCGHTRDGAYVVRTVGDDQRRASSVRGAPRRWPESVSWPIRSWIARSCSNCGASYRTSGSSACATPSPICSIRSPKSWRASPRTTGTRSSGAADAS